jgi:hypothetical protein
LSERAREVSECVTGGRVWAGGRARVARRGGVGWGGGATCHLPTVDEEGCLLFCECGAWVRACFCGAVGGAHNTCR